MGELGDEAVLDEIEKADDEQTLVLEAALVQQSDNRGHGTEEEESGDEA